MGATFCLPQCPTTFESNGETCVYPGGNAELISYNFVSSFDQFTSQAGASINAILGSSTSALSATGRGLYFDGQTNDFVYFDSQPVLNNEFSIHSWVYALSVNGRVDAMTLFNKYVDEIENIGSLDFLTFGVNNNLQLQVGLRPSFGATTDYSTQTASTELRLFENTWEYIVYKLKIINNENTEVSMELYDDDRSI